MTTPLLAYPNFDKNFILETDDSKLGVGTILFPTHDDIRLHPVVYASGSGSTSKVNYTISGLVTLAMVWGVTHFHYYLYGHNVTAVTDHTAVKAILGALKSHRKDEQSTVCYCGG